MSCLNTKVDKYDKNIFSFTVDKLEKIDIKIDNLISGINVKVDPNNRLSIFTDKYTNNLVISTDKVCCEGFELPIITYTRKKPIQISFGIVCSVEELVYMNVSPETVQWLTPDMGIIYEVTSNVDWNIQY